MQITLSDENIAGDVYIGAGETQIIRLFAQAAKQLQKKYLYVYLLTPFMLWSSWTKALLILAWYMVRWIPENMKRSRSPAKTLGGSDAKGFPFIGKAVDSAGGSVDKPLIISNQKNNDWPLSSWLGKDLDKLNIVATYNLLFNASLLTSEGLGYTLCFDRLVNTAGDSNLCFRPLSRSWNRAPPLSGKSTRCFQSPPKSSFRRYK